MRRTIICGAVASLAALAQTFAFRAHPLETGFQGAYQVTLADLNGDGRLDIIALASGQPELWWYENRPDGFQRHVLARGLSRMINLAVGDTDGDGRPEILIAHAFSNIPKESAGIVSVLTPGPDVHEPWNAREVDRLPTSHRIRVGRFDGRLAFVNAPLAGAEVEPPDYRGAVPLVLYRGPSYRRELISGAEQGVMHGIWVGRWNRGDRDDSVLTASFRGVHRYWPHGATWQSERVTAGDPAPWPRSGASEIAPGRAEQEARQPWFATLEPWHGHQVVIYEKGARRVIDNTLVDGHVLLTGDLDGDGKNEVVAGYRGKGASVFAYYRQAGQWKRVAIDEGGMAAAGCALGDLNSDGRIDVVCLGTSTANLKWYENLGRHSDARR
jgi:hypothetical protein